MAAYETANLDEIASSRWPHWIPVRHHFGIETFGVNLWRGQDDGTVIPEHDESGSGAPELYYVAEGHATFTVAGDEVDAPAGTCVWVKDPSAKRAGRTSTPETLVLSVSGASPGEAYAPAGWDSHYLAGDK
jgi:quercetin dioxygenase-like cupin family protein